MHSFSALSVDLSCLSSWLYGVRDSQSDIQNQAGVGCLRTAQSTQQIVRFWHRSHAPRCVSTQSERPISQTCVWSQSLPQRLYSLRIRRKKKNKKVGQRWARKVSRISLQRSSLSAGGPCVAHARARAGLVHSSEWPKRLQLWFSCWGLTADFYLKSNFNQPGFQPTKLGGAWSSFNWQDLGLLLAGWAVTLWSDLDQLNKVCTIIEMLLISFGPACWRAQDTCMHSVVHVNLHCASVQTVVVKPYSRYRS